MNAMNAKPLSLFVPHGAPTFALNPGAAGHALRAYAAGMSLPRAIVMISAHWDTPMVSVGFAQRLDTIHDFYGFPQALYALRYPASGCPELAEEVAAAVEAEGLPVVRDTQRGLDHGAWVPLSLMFPDAVVPVIPVSLQSAAGPAQALRLGRALAPLAEKGLLVMGSGNLTHNLRDYQRAAMQGGRAPDYVRPFADWFALRLERMDIPALLDYRAQAPAAQNAHPSAEHLLPLFVALGAAGAEARAERFYSGIADYVLAMDAYAFYRDDSTTHEANQ